MRTRGKYHLHFQTKSYIRLSLWSCCRAEFYGLVPQVWYADCFVGWSSRKGHFLLAWANKSLHDPLPLFLSSIRQLHGSRLSGVPFPPYVLGLSMSSRPTSRHPSWLVRSLCPFERRVLGHPGPGHLCHTTQGASYSELMQFKNWVIPRLVHFFAACFTALVSRAKIGHKSLVKHFGMKNLVDINSHSWHLNILYSKAACISKHPSLLHFCISLVQDIGRRIIFHHESEPYSFHHPHECAFPKSWASSWSAMWCPSQMVCGRVANAEANCGNWLKKDICLSATLWPLKS